MILITAAQMITTEPSKIIAVDSEIFRVGDGVVIGDSEGIGERVGEGFGVGEDVGVGEGFAVGVGEAVRKVEGSTKFAGSINGARGIWRKLNEFIMSLALASLVPNEGRLKMSSASLSIEANSYWVWSM